MGMSQWIKNHIRETEWIITAGGDAWYNGYYDNGGRQVEKETSLGVRMMLTSQVFTIMSGISTKDQTEKIIEAVDKYLYSGEIGGYRLNTDFHEIKTDLGRMFGFAYGHKENGAVFSHMTVMYAYALYKRGFVREGFKAIDSLYRHLSDFSKSKVYPGITEYINEKGEGMYHYLTGSASWLLLTVLTQMYGIRGSGGDLIFEPKLLLEQFDDVGKAAVTCEFADRRLKVIYHNTRKNEYGRYMISEIRLNNKLMDSNKQISRSIINQLNFGEEHLIDIVLL
jgi:cellobiose phosphorylase